ncbi:MAG: hypothetical protein JWN25_2824 [Verrucomicrobiales bacterium]|nr:hypothetical protein [Verrucomicrobiales bacterium]
MNPKQILQLIRTKMGISRHQPSALDLFGTLPTDKSFITRDAERNAVTYLLGEAAAKAGTTVEPNR